MSQYGKRCEAKAESEVEIVVKSTTAFEKPNAADNEGAA